MKLKPLGDRIVIKPEEKKETTVSGLILPESAKEKPQQGKVKAAGKGLRNAKGKRVKLDVKKGDTVLYGKYSGTEVKLGGKTYLVMKESDVLAVVGKAKKKKAKEAKPAEDVKPDDLKKIEGIGPKISSILIESGIATFKQLSKAKPAKIKEVLAEAGSRYRMADPATWPDQAKLAAKGAWEDLKSLQDSLDGGKR